MVRLDQEAEVADGGECGEQWADNVLVDALECQHFFAGLAFMTGLVGSLDVDTDEVIARQDGDRGTTFGGIVSVKVAGRSGHVDPRPAEQRADAADQIDRRHERAAGAVGRGERLNRGRLAETPEPDLRGRLLAGREALRGHGVPGDDAFRRLHERDQDFAPGAGRQVVREWPARDVVRGLGAGAGERVRAAVAAVDEQVAVTDARVELETVRRARARLRAF